MDKDEFEIQRRAFKPLIEKIFSENIRFYRFHEPINWSFGFDDDTSIMAVCNRKTNLITINLNSVIISYNLDGLKTVEYYILHEMRHAFQHSIIKDYKNGKEIPIDKEIVEKWVYEVENYIKVLDENGNEIQEYFLQDSEMDAYAFSYAVMKYKYKNVSDLYVPPTYGVEFYGIVQSWLNTFKEENL